ncbi:MAG: hypothetical protein ACLQPH_11460 [Acidimicrobiales bacterium]
MTPTISRFESWQEMERALSLVHVTGLELIAEIKADGEQSESTARQRFDEALAAFHDALGKLEMLPHHLRSGLPSPGGTPWGTCANREG